MRREWCYWKRTEEIKSWIKFGHGNVPPYRTRRYNEKFNTQYLSPYNKLPTNMYLPISMQTLRCRLTMYNILCEFISMFYVKLLLVFRTFKLGTVQDSFTLLWNLNKKAGGWLFAAPKELQRLRCCQIFRWILLPCVVMIQIQRKLSSLLVNCLFKGKPRNCYVLNSWFLREVIITIWGEICCYKMYFIKINNILHH